MIAGLGSLLRFIFILNILDFAEAAAESQLPAAGSIHLLIGLSFFMV